jgi:RNA polymerase sigma factor (sigma-70 family)
LVSKVLRAFCRDSRCEPGGCLPEDLLAESYIVFRKALEEYDPSYGVDFLGYVSQRLRWRLGKRVTRDRNKWPALPPPHAPETEESGEDVEAQLMDRLFLAQALDAVSEADAELLTLRYGVGYSTNELAESLGLAPATLRKRFQRLRARLRRACSDGD